MIVLGRMNKRDLILEELKSNYGKILAFTKHGITKNHHDAEDLVSEAITKFIDSYDRGTNNYQPGTNICGYLMSVVKTLSIDKGRKISRNPKIVPLFKTIKNKEGQLEASGEEVININEFEDNETKLDGKRIMEVMKNILNKDDFQIMYLVYCLSYKFHEVSKLLNINQGTIGSKINRSVKKIREELKKKSVRNIKEIKKWKLMTV